MIAPEVPPPDEITLPWWEATRDRRLLVQTCAGCAGTQHPPRALCVHCGSERLNWSTSAGAGVVDSFTVVYRAPRPELDVPYVIARVRLAEGVILLTRLEGRPEEEWRIDDPVRLTWVDLDDGRALPVFVPAGVS